MAGFTPLTIFRRPPSDRWSSITTTTYTGDPTVMVHQATCEWIHALSTIFAALAGAGLTIKMFREHEVLPWRGLSILIPCRGTRRFATLHSACPYAALPS
jgi:hypothetical protein